MCCWQHRFLSLRRFLFLAVLAGLTIGPVLPALAYQSIHDDGTSRLQPWTNCTGCHGADLMGGFGPACTTCHQPFSNPDLPPTGHHVSGRADATVNCVLCHGSDLMGADLGGGTTTPSCYSCHGQLWNEGNGENLPPTAVPGGPYAATVGVAIQFDASGSTDPDGDTLTYIWEFGDGSFPSGGGSPIASHAYATAGTYTATLAVADGVNLPDAAEVQVTITNTNAPPTASAGGPYTGTANQSTQLDASGSSDPDGDTLSYTWDFGDGSAVAGPSGNATASHTYQTAGTYVATVTVSDGVNDPVTSVADVDIAEDTSGGGGGGGNPPPTTGNGWDVQYPWLGIAGTVSFNDFGPWFLVTQTVDNGPAMPGFGFRLDNNVVWLDASGSLFVGFQPAAADSMWGMVFNFPGGVNSIWFAQPQAPAPSLDLGGLGDLLGSLGLGGTGSGSGSTGGTSGAGSSTTTGGDTSSSGTTDGSTPASTTTSTRPRAYDVYQERGDSYAPSFAPTESH